MAFEERLRQACLRMLAALPDVIEALTVKALAGDVQAIRLVLALAGLLGEGEVDAEQDTDHGGQAVATAAKTAVN